ncbi:MAG: aminotransferase class I/II-fold pyridoxal phosphate-dependent enzyme [Trueperaceae bacterium]
MKDARGFDTLQVHAAQETADPTTGARAVPIYLTSSFVFASAADAQGRFAGTEPGYQYGRMHNPTVEAFARRVQALEGGAASVALSSGQAATTAILLAIARPGTNIVLSREVFGGTFSVARKVLEPWGCSVRPVAPEADAITEALDRDTVGVWVESIANPSGTVPDLPAVADAAHKANVPLIVDNTFGAGGYLCQPLEQGADAVVHSATKWIGGHGTFVGGVVVDGASFDWDQERYPAFHALDGRGRSPVTVGGKSALAARVHDLGLFTMGMTLSPHDAFLGLQGLETLSLRVARECASALELARWLEHQQGVARVVYPGLEHHPSHEVAKRVLRNGFGAVLCFETDTVERAHGFLDRVELASHLANIGDAKTVVINPWTTTHASMSEDARRAAGVTPALVRVSVGIEDLSDLKADFAQALDVPR